MGSFTALIVRKKLLSDETVINIMSLISLISLNIKKDFNFEFIEC